MSQTQALHLLGEGIAAAQAGDKPLTRRLLREATTLDPLNEVSWLWLAGVVETPQEALACLERVLEINPGNEKAQADLKATWFQVGIAAANGGNKPLARRLLTEATRQDPGNEMGWMWLASVAESASEAVLHLERVLTINPNNEPARSGLAYYRSQLPPPKLVWECPLCLTPAEAKQDRCPSCRAFLRLDQLDALFLDAQVDEDKVRKAVGRLEAAHHGEGDFATHFHLGVAYLNLKRFDEAIVHFRDALQLKSDRVLRLQLNTLFQRKALLESAAQEKAEQERRANQKTVLIVDDSPTVRKIVAVTLERGGHRALTAADAYEAMKHVRESGLPDLILLDITMPGMDGYQFCKLLRGNRETARLPIVMLSGKDSFFSKIKGELAGSTEYMTKPFQPEALIRVVEKY